MKRIPQIDRLMFAQMQTSNILKLIEGNQFEKHMSEKLWSVYYELDRQIKNFVYADKNQ